MSDAPQITIYSTPTCAFCRTEKQYLESLGVKYIERNIEDDEARDELLEKLGGDFRGVPTTDIGGKIIIGFDRPKIDAALKDQHLLV